MFTENSFKFNLNVEEIYKMINKFNNLNQLDSNISTDNATIKANTN